MAIVLSTDSPHGSILSISGNTIGLISSLHWRKAPVMAPRILSAPLGSSGPTLNELSMPFDVQDKQGL